MDNLDQIKSRLNEAAEWGYIPSWYPNYIIQTINDLKRELAIKEEDLYNKQHEIDNLKERLELIRKQRDILKEV